MVRQADRELIIGEFLINSHLFPFSRRPAAPVKRPQHRTQAVEDIAAFAIHHPPPFGWPVTINKIKIPKHNFVQSGSYTRSLKQTPHKIEQ